MAVAWPEGVNTNAYGMDIGSGSNVERIEFESGKSRTYLKNSVGKKRFSFLLSMVDDGPGSEFLTFVAWWDNVLLSGSLSFLFPDLLTHSGLAEYKPVNPEYGARGQLRKEVTLEVEEQ